MDINEIIKSYGSQKREIENNDNLSATGKAEEIVRLQTKLRQQFTEYETSTNQKIDDIDKEITELKNNAPSRPVPNSDSILAETRAIDLILSQLVAAIDDHSFMNQAQSLENGSEFERMAFVRGFHKIVGMVQTTDPNVVAQLKVIYENISKSLITPAQGAHAKKAEAAKTTRGELSAGLMLNKMIFNQLNIPKYPGRDPWKEAQK